MAVMPGDPLQQATDATSSDPMGEVETGAEDDGKPPVYRVKADFQYDGALGISWVPDPETGRPIIKVNFPVHKRQHIASRSQGTEPVFLRMFLRALVLLD